MTHPGVGYSAAEGPMLVAEEAVEIRVLRRQGKSIREIARMLRTSRNTVRRYLRSEGLPHYQREAGPGKLDPFKSYLGRKSKSGGTGLDTGDRPAARAQSARLYGWLQHPEGVPCDPAAGGEAGSSSSIRHRTRTPAAGGLRYHPQRTRPAVGVHRDTGLEPGDLR